MMIAVALRSIISQRPNAKSGRQEHAFECGFQNEACFKSCLLKSNIEANSALYVDVLTIIPAAASSFSSKLMRAAFPHVSGSLSAAFVGNRTDFFKRDFSRRFWSPKSSSCAPDKARHGVQFPSCGIWQDRGRSRRNNKNTGTWSAK